MPIENVIIAGGRGASLNLQAELATTVLSSMSIAPASMCVKYVIVSPVRDEDKYIRFTLDSIVAQTVRPTEWILVNDGSTDTTAAIVDDYASRFPWIRVIHRQNRGFRKPGGGVVDAFYEGYKSVACTDWEFIVKLDGDLSLRSDYFESCFYRFRNESALGIAGGTLYHESNGRLMCEENPRFHVRGATKIYRRECWDAIGGLFPAPGWDTIDEVKANMLGFKTRSFTDLPVIHHRITGTAEGLWRDQIKHGLACYVSGYHPLFVFASCIYRLARKPYFIRSAAILYGFAKGYLAHHRRVDDNGLVRYLRKQQLSRLFGKETIWK